jgi:ABC-type antimicrobial peptide transport system permease subunit
MQSPYKPVNPLMIYYDKTESAFIDLRINNKLSAHESIKKIEEIINKYNPAYVFEYEFVDEAFNRKFMNEELISNLASIFSILAIFICCIGMAGLTSFTIEKRTREMGVRKVLGASLTQLVILISHEFTKLVVIALVISIPSTWLLMNNWLQDYAFHTDISIWLFVLVGILILALTFVIVFFNTLKTANANPTKNLRTE